MWCRRLALLVVGVGVVIGCSDDTDPPAATGSRDAFCAELRAAVEADLTVFDPLQPVSPEDTRAAMDRLTEAAPGAIAAEVRLLDESFTAVTEVLDQVDLADPEAAAQIEALELDAEAIAAAQDAVAGYALDQCGIDLAAINAASVSTTTAPPATTAPPTTVPTTTPTTVPPG